MITLYSHHKFCRTSRISNQKCINSRHLINLAILAIFIVVDNLEDPDISIQDMMILELLQWFKVDFFVWVDSPPCEFCGESTKFSHMSTDPKLLLYTDRVEVSDVLCELISLKN